MNNLVYECYTGVYAQPFATVTHNAVWDWVYSAYSGIPILGQHVQTNANGDSCDYYFNLTVDPGVVAAPESGCGLQVANCASALIGGGDPAFGSRHIGFPDSTCNSTDVREVQGTPMPSGFVLEQNNPNPFNATTDIHFAIPIQAHVRLDVANIVGQTVAVLFDGECKAGHFVASWDGRNAAGQSVGSGVYLYRIASEQFTQTRKMVLLK